MEHFERTLLNRFLDKVSMGVGNILRPDQAVDVMSYLEEEANRW